MSRVISPPSLLLAYPRAFWWLELGTKNEGSCSQEEPGPAWVGDSLVLRPEGSWELGQGWGCARLGSWTSGADPRLERAGLLGRGWLWGPAVSCGSYRRRSHGVGMRCEKEGLGFPVSEGGSHTCHGPCPRLRVNGTRQASQAKERPGVPTCCHQPRTALPWGPCLPGLHSSVSRPWHLSQGQPRLGLGDPAPDLAALGRERRMSGDCTRATKEAGLVVLDRP